MAGRMPSPAGWFFKYVERLGSKGKRGRDCFWDGHGSLRDRVLVQVTAALFEMDNSWGEKRPIIGNFQE